MIKRLLILLFVLGIANFSNAKGQAEKKGLPPTVLHLVAIAKNDSSRLQVRKLNKKAIDNYTKDPDFDYKETTLDESWWDRMWDWLWHFIDNLFSGKKPAATSGYYVKYVLMALLIGFVIWGIMKAAGLTGMFIREPEEMTIPYTESLENIHQIAFGAEIEKAIDQRNYRLAVRLLYLQSLKLMNDRRLINWQLEKTNYVYINELTDKGQRQSFNILTRQFEYVWYGDFPVDGESFKHIDGLFTDFKKMLE